MSSIQDEQLTHVFRAHRTLMQMLRDRGYLVTDENLNMTKEELN